MLTLYPSWGKTSFRVSISTVYRLHLWSYAHMQVERSKLSKDSFVHWPHQDVSCDQQIFFSPSTVYCPYVREPSVLLVEDECSQLSSHGTELLIEHEVEYYICNTTEKRAVTSRLLSSSLAAMKQHCCFSTATTVSMDSVVTKFNEEKCNGFYVSKCFAEKNWMRSDASLLSRY